VLFWVWFPSQIFGSTGNDVFLIHNPHLLNFFRVHSTKYRYRISSWPAFYISCSVVDSKLFFSEPDPDSDPIFVRALDPDSDPDHDPLLLVISY
jgi:hypothetical protein